MTCQHAFRKSAFVWFVFMLSLALAFSLSFCAQKNTTLLPARVDRLALEVERAQSARTVAIDEHYFSSPNYQGGWSAAKDPSPGALRLGAAAPGGYPPDIPLTALGERQRGFLGGTGNPIVWPAILPMWFHYRNPVSGRVPENFWLDCVTCAYAPNTSMKNHGYQLPPW